MALALGDGWTADQDDPWVPELAPSVHALCAWLGPLQERIIATATSQEGGNAMNIGFIGLGIMGQPILPIRLPPQAW